MSSTPVNIHMHLPPRKFGAKTDHCTVRDRTFEFDAVLVRKLEKILARHTPNNCWFSLIRLDVRHLDSAREHVRGIRSVLDSHLSPLSALELELLSEECSA